MRSPLIFALVASACGSTGPVGGPVDGGLDTHCIAADGGAIVQEVSQASCNLTGDGGVDAIDYGDTLFGSAGSDDDCKYNVKWTATPIQENHNVTFTAIVTSRVDGSPVTGGAVYTETYLNDTHPSPNPSTTPVPVENPPGTYAYGPVLFDAPGEWTVRFHIWGACSDFADDSPHAHAAFYVEVP